MGRYDEFVNNLVVQESDLHTSNEYLFSIYIPFSFTNLEDTKIRTKSALLNQLRNHEYLGKESEYHSILVDTIIEYIDQVPIKGKGVAFFIKNNISDVLSGKERNIPQGDISIVPLFKHFEESIYIGKIFNLDQLVWLNRIDQDALVISLETKDTYIYLYRENELKELKSMAKDDWDFTKPKHFEKTNITSSYSASYGSSKDKFDRFDQQTVGFFVDKVLEEVKDVVKDSVEYIVIYYSNEFSPFVNDIREYINDRFDVKTIMLNRSLKRKDELVGDVLNVLEEDREEENEELFKRAKENINLYEEGWEKVLSMVRDGRIDTLFAQANLSKEGNISKSGLIYTEKGDDSVLVQNIYPWLVRAVISMGGDIVLLKENGKISALLRY